MYLCLCLNRVSKASVFGIRNIALDLASGKHIALTAGVDLDPLFELIQEVKKQ